MIRDGFGEKGGPLLVILALAVVILTLGSPAWGQEGGATPPPEKGAQHCAQQRPMLMVIRNPEQLRGLLGEGSSQAQAVDFRKQAIVAVYLGQKMTGGYGVEFKEPYEEKGRLVVPFQERVPGPDRFVTQALTTPCRLKPVAVKEGQEVVAKNLLEVSGLAYQPMMMGKNLFKCEIPRGWYREVYEKLLDQDVGGMMLMAPAEMEGEGVKIFVTHYGQADETLVQNPAAYADKYPHAEISKYRIQEKFKAAARPPASGLKASWYDRESVITLRDQSKRKLTVKEQLAVVPGAQGFYVLHYWAPAAIFHKYAPVFLRVAQSFQPVVCVLRK